MKKLIFLNSAKICPATFRFIDKMLGEMQSLNIRKNLNEVLVIKKHIKQMLNNFRNHLNKQEISMKCKYLLFIVGERRNKIMILKHINIVKAIIIWLTRERMKRNKEQLRL